MSLCPSCGREVGSHVTCPYCGANLKRRMTIALFGVLAIVLAVGGLALLYYFSISTPVPVVRISQIQAAMNYAYVRIEGVVARNPNYNADSESITFWVDDGSGQMLVTAFRSEARALVETDRVPSIGDRVTVEGTLRVRDDSPSLALNTTEALAVERAVDAASVRDLNSIVPDDALSAVTVRGQVRAVREPYEGLRILTLRDATGAIDVTIDGDVDQFSQPTYDAQVGDSIEVTGVVTLFEGAPQITLTRGEYLARLDQPISLAELTPIRDLGDDDIGRWVRVQGTLSRIDPFSAGVKFTLDDPQGRGVILLLWQDVFDSLQDADDWQIGAEVIVQGQVNVFRGELEIVPELALDASMLTRAVVEESPALLLTGLGTITQDDIGRTVFISGTIESVDRFASGVRFQIEDDTGSIQLVLFDDVYEQVEDADGLVEGVNVSALGRVGEFNDALEVIPPNGASVRLLSGPRVAQATLTPEPLTISPTPAATPRLTVTLTATPTPKATPAFTATSTVAATPTSSGVTPIGAIDPSFIGQTVTVRGQVLSVSSFSAGFRFTLNDGSGSIQLVLFDGRYREVADHAGLNLGAQVRVAAVVVEFNGILELQPASGEDVRVEQVGSSSIIKTRAINTLSNADLGTLTAIVGDVLRVEGFSAGVNVFVNDGSGELRVVVFNNVLNYVPNAATLQAGARVRVVGRIDEFSGALELVPALGYDVTINP